MHIAAVASTTNWRGHDLGRASRTTTGHQERIVLAESFPLRSKGAMVQRTRLQSKTDDLAFPVRVKLAVPPGGLGPRLTAIGAWFQGHAGKGNYAVHSALGLAGDTMAVYFREVEMAQAFVAAFPDVKLADGTLSGAHYSPSARHWRYDNIVATWP
ncbi:MAG: hypothetical protein NVS3B5_14240 [Sphingomicrobium sp.]